MITNPKCKGAVFRDPIRRREARIHKIEDLVGNGIALKADFSGYNALGVRGVVDSADRDGRELSAVLAVENNAVDAVRERGAVFSVDHHVANRDLAHQRLTARLGIYDAREPVKVVFVVDLLCRFKDFCCIFQHNSAILMIPIHVKREDQRDRSYRNE